MKYHKVDGQRGWMQKFDKIFGWFESRLERQGYWGSDARREAAEITARLMESVVFETIER